MTPGPASQNADGYMSARLNSIWFLLTLNRPLVPQDGGRPQDDLKGGHIGRPSFLPVHERAQVQLVDPAVRLWPIGDGAGDAVFQIRHGGLALGFMEFCTPDGSLRREAVA